MRALGLAGIILSVAVIMVGVGFPLSWGPLLAFAGLAGCLVSLLAFRRGPPTKEERFLAQVVLWAVAGRLLLAGLLHSSELWFYFGGDEGTFDSNGRVFLLWMRGECPVPIGIRFLGSLEVAYFYMVGFLYYAFGLGKAVPLLLNALVGASIVLPVHYLAGRWGGREAARRAALLVAFFPSLVLWSSVMVRDVLVLFCIAVALVQTYRLRRGVSPGALVLLVLCLLALGTLRAYIGVLLAVALTGGVILGQRRPTRALVVGGLLMGAMVLAFRHGGVGQSELERANLETLAMHRYYNTIGPSESGSLGEADIATPTQALAYLPLGLVYFYFSPLPWQMGSLRSILSAPDIVLWYSILPSIVLGMAWLVRRRFGSVLPLLLTVIGISVLYALVEGNIGIIFRHRAHVIVPLCVVAGVGHALRVRARRKESRRLAGPVPLHASAGGALRPAPGLRIPSSTP